MSGKAIILDCDPGVDDAIAILLTLAASDRLDLKGITTVAGNVPLAQTSSNARRICQLAGRNDVSVYAGCAQPLLSSLTTAEKVHGTGGLGGLELPDTEVALAPGHAVGFIIDSCLAAEDGAITLCPVGPLTNIAMALAQEPGIKPKIREIVLMGGVATARGNVTPVAEFNVYCDPHAAAAVFDSGCPLVMFGLDLTQQVRTTPDRLQKIAALGGPVAEAVATMLSAYGSRETQEAAPLHDPCVIAYLLHPELFAGERLHVAVETASPLTRGQTVTDWNGVGGYEANTLVMTEADADGFYDLLTEHLGRF